MITRTLFPDAGGTYLILLSFSKPYHFDTILLIVYVVQKLVYPKYIQYHFRNESIPQLPLQWKHIQTGHPAS